MNIIELIDYLGRLGYGAVTARGIAKMAGSASVNLGADGTVCPAGTPGRYLIVGARQLDTDTDLIEHAAKCAS